MSAIHWVRRQLRWGYDVMRFQVASHPLARRQRWLEACQIRTVVDVGANTGQYALQLRELAFTGHIISIEPLREAYGAHGNISGLTPQQTVARICGENTGKAPEDEHGRPHGW